MLGKYHRKVINFVGIFSVLKKLVNLGRFHLKWDLYKLAFPFASLATIQLHHKDWANFNQKNSTFLAHITLVRPAFTAFTALLPFLLFKNLGLFVTLQSFYKTGLGG